ncbi:small oligopeptide transporter [Cristinia sonorae]|uniref:Small oligopeptide transporter n=1 Tax=Cristinia sonorae TaxID=1940300 RepID=A0A8K0UMU1_9AGAR|nr:small oligopeptide transporter [Cristinia sonorae]
MHEFRPNTDDQVELEPVASPPYEPHDIEKSSNPAVMFSRGNSLRTPSLRSRLSGQEFDDPTLDADGPWLEDDSPYPEVRSAVANFDDPSMPVSTLRAWVLGVLFAIVMPAINQFFSLRYPSILVGPLVAQLIAYPCGRFWARFAPEVTVFNVSLNPGPFTIKEHVLVTIMAGVGAQAAYATEIVAVQRIFYDERYNFSYQWMLVMSTQLIGFSVGGLTRRLLVAPASMIWPNTLVICALYNTLHSQYYAGIGPRSGLSRERFFTYAFIGATLWYFVPGYLFSALSMFSWVCWIAPNNVKVNLLFGYRSGMGFSLLTLDWNQVALIGSPLVTPWWAEANVVAGFVFFYWFLTPVLYFSNVWYSQYMPISSSMSFDREAKPYNLTKVLNADSTFNEEAYEAYSPLFLSTTFAISYGLSFAAISSTIVHTILYFRKPISIHLSRSLGEQPDIHAQLMTRYNQVPDWWYGCIFAVTFAFACICVKVYPTQMPIWAVVVALLISLFFVVPVGMIQAVTTRQVGLNVITELIAGYMLPGMPMVFTWGYISMAQGTPWRILFTQDFKIGHYMKIPPRAMFCAQVVSTVIAGTVQLGVLSWMFTAIPDICKPEQRDKSGFTCVNTQVFGTASVVWGVVGPQRQFSKGTLYYVPLIFAGIGYIPQASAVNYVPWALVGFLFQYIIRRRHFPFWAKYNYVLSAALDAGTAVGTILVYFWQVSSLPP